MAGGTLRPNLIRRLETGARTSATAVLPGKVDADAQPPPAAAEVDPVVKFTDTKDLFSSVGTGKLLRSVITLRLAATEPVADLGMWIMKSKLMDEPLCRKAVMGVTERTFYRHFCAGEDQAAAMATARDLWGSGLTAMLDYGLEHAIDGESCESNLGEIIATIDATKSVDESPVSFILIRS